MHRVPDSQVLVVDTETRHLPAESAREIVREVMSTAALLKPSLIYKKTDSALRGNIAAEFQGLLDALPGAPIVYSPAYPELGRTVRGGRLLVDGVPVEETAFACDPLNPVTCGYISQLLAAVPVTIVDAETEAQVRAAALRIIVSDPRPIAAGPAGLAQWLPPRRCCPMALPRLARCLVVNGSLHPASAAQITLALECGLFHDYWQLCDRDPASVCAALSNGGFDGLVVFGGDTAFAIHHALGSADFETVGEVLPGVPVSRRAGLVWVTKAGGFGSPEVLCDIRRRLS